MTTALSILRDVFGHDGFRPQQSEVVDHVWNGGDAVVLFPTGSGKSLCFQIPSIGRNGVGIVVEPLLSLIRDQVTRLEQLGVQVATINSSISASDRREIVEALRMGQIDLLYVTPEQVATARFQDLLREIDIAAFCIDEVHAMIEFGADFRPDYNCLGILKTLRPDVPLISATATADAETLAEIIRRLDIPEARVFQSSFDRANISYSMRIKSKKPKEQVLEVLRGHEDESVIVYCIGRATVEKTAGWLTEAGFPALPYHAGMKDADRERNQDAFISGEARIIVATVAFGMGIDKADVRCVIHTDLPKTVEAFYQESGRAGRDGLPARSYVFFGNGNVVQRQRMAKKSQGGAVVKRTGQAKIDAMVGLVETSECRRRAILHYFGETYSGSCGNCDNCEDRTGTVDVSVEAGLVLSLVRSGYSLTAHDIVQFAAGTSALALAPALADLAAEFRRRKQTGLMWAAIVRQMTASGFLEVSYARQTEISAAAAAEDLLAERGMTFRKSQHLTSAKSRSAGTRKAPTKSPRTVSRSTPRARRNPYEVEAVASADDLLTALSKKRAQLARAEKVKEYYVMHNSALEEMANSMPRNGRELLAIKGIGEKKVAQYGGVFLGIINQFAA